MALPMRRRPEDEQWWNPALPTGAAPRPMAPPQQQPPSSDVLDPFAGPPVPAPQPMPPRVAPVQAPPAAPPQTLGAQLGQPPPPAPSGEAEAYDPDVIDVLSAGLRGFAGNHGPSMREQRWNQQQDRQQKQDTAAYEAWLGQKRLDSQESRDQALQARWGALGDAADHRLENQDKTIAIKEEQAKRLADAQDYWMNPDNAQAKKVQELFAQEGEPRAAGLSMRSLQALNPVLFDDAIKRLHAPEDAAIAARQAGMVAGSATSARERVQLPYDIAGEQRDIVNAGAKDEAKREALSASRRAIPGLTITNESAYDTATADDPTYRKMLDSASAYRALLTSLDKMRAIRSKHGVEIPGAAQGEYDLAKTTAIGAVTKLGETGVLNQGEWDRYSKAIPGITPSVADIPNMIGMDIKGGQLEGVRKALADTVESRLYQWGVRYDEGTLPQGGHESRGGPRKRRSNMGGAPAPAAGGVGGIKPSGSW